MSDIIGKADALLKKQMQLFKVEKDEKAESGFKILASKSSTRAGEEILDFKIQHIGNGILGVSVKNRTDESRGYSTQIKASQVNAIYSKIGGLNPVYVCNPKLGIMIVFSDESKSSSDNTKDSRDNLQQSSLPKSDEQKFEETENLLAETQKKLADGRKTLELLAETKKRLIDAGQSLAELTGTKKNSRKLEEAHRETDAAWRDSEESLAEVTQRVEPQRYDKLKRR